MEEKCLWNEREMEGGRERGREGGRAARERARCRGRGRSPPVPRQPAPLEGAALAGEPRIGRMPPKKKEVEVEKPMLGRFSSHLKVRGRCARRGCGGGGGTAAAAGCARRIRSDAPIQTARR